MACLHAAHRRAVYTAQCCLESAATKPDQLEHEILPNLSSQDTLYVITDQVSHPRIVFYDHLGHTVLSLQPPHCSIPKSAFQSRKLLVGCHLKDSLRSIWFDEQMRQFFQLGGRLWDTTYANYLLSAQRPFPLNHPLELQAGPPRVDAALRSPPTPNTCDKHPIPTSFSVLRDLVQKQMHHAVKRQQLQIIWHRMDAVGWSLDLERNGIFFASDAIRREKLALGEESVSLEQTMTRMCTEWLGISASLGSDPSFPWISTWFWRALYFGGDGVSIDVEFTEKPFNTLSKKSIKIDFPYIATRFPSAVQRDELFLKYLIEWEDTSGAATRPTDDTTTVWSFLHGSGGLFTDVIPRCAANGCVLSKTLLRYRRLLTIRDILLLGDSMRSADAAKGYLGYITPKTGCIHAQFAVDTTATTRLQASQPNVFTIPKDVDFRKFMTSRFGTGGKILEADFSQLELRVAAVLSQDTAMIRMLNDDVDFHTHRATLIRPHLTYDEIERKTKRDRLPEFIKLRSQAKTFSFQRLYGASAMSIANATGLSHAEVTRMIDAEKELFPQLESFYRTVEAEVEGGGLERHADATEIPLSSEWALPTGTRVAFLAQVPLEGSDWWSRRPKQRFSGTQMRNYPIQCFAAEIVQLTLGRLWRHFLRTSNYQHTAILVNAVHDSVWVDCQAKVIGEVAADVQEILEDCWGHVRRLFPQLRSMHTVPFPVSVSAGCAMDTMDELAVTRDKGTNKQ